MWLDPGLLLSLKSEVLAGRDHTGEVLNVAILSFQRQPTPPFSFYSGSCRSCDVPPVGAFISSARWSLDQTGWRNWPPISVPACSAWRMRCLRSAQVATRLGTPAYYCKSYVVSDKYRPPAYRSGDRLRFQTKQWK